MNAIFKCNHCRYPSYALIYILKTCFQLHTNIPPLQAFWGLQIKAGKTFQEVNSKIPVWLHPYIWTVTISWQNKWSPSYSFLNHLRLDSAKPSSTSLSRHLLKKTAQKTRELLKCISNMQHLCLSCHYVLWYQSLLSDSKHRLL